MNRFIYLGVFIISVLVLGAGVLFLCAAISLPERWPLALVLLGLGAAGAGWSAYAYRRWSGLQPAALAARVTNLAAENKGELGVAQIMSTLGIPAALATETLDTLVQQGQARREARDAQVVYVFPALQEHRMVRKCVYCGSTFPVKQALQKCPNCGGRLELQPASGTTD